MRRWRSHYLPARDAAWDILVDALEQCLSSSFMMSLVSKSTLSTLNTQSLGTRQPENIVTFQAEGAIFVGGTRRMFESFF